MFDLEAILKYEMTELEAKAFKIALLWEDSTKKEFPNYNHVKLRKKGDPRKSLLFKYTYKLARETQDIIEDSQYRLYVLAQLHIFKNIKGSDDIQARIDPGILCGDKAWRRWKRWKRIYDQKVKEYDREYDRGSATRKLIVEKDLLKTKNFFIQKYGQEPTSQQIYQAMHDHTMIRWVTIDRVSPYYILCSPCIKQSLEGRSFNEFFLFDLGVYEESITQEVKDIFQQMFDYEF